MDVRLDLLLLRLDDDVQKVAEVTKVLLLPSVLLLLAPFGRSERFPCSGSGDVPAKTAGALDLRLQKGKVRRMRNLDGNSIDKIRGAGTYGGGEDLARDLRWRRRRRSRSRAGTRARVCEFWWRLCHGLLEFI